MVRSSFVVILSIFLICLPGGNAHGSVEPNYSPVAGDGEGLHFRGGHRSRKPSLSDTVPVERIAALDQQEEFKDATEDINKEMQKSRGGR